MSIFNSDFMLTCDPARRLYHDYLADLPIIDYHTHLPPEEIEENRMYGNLTRIWLDHDHYKWRAMRTMGIEERLITGEATDGEKFRAWSITLAGLIRNPLYHWSHLELDRILGIRNIYICPDTADNIFQAAEELLSSDEFRVREILRRMKVIMIGTTDDPADSLSSHEKITGDKYPFIVLPTFRPDRYLALDSDSWKDDIARLEEICGKEINGYDDLVERLAERADHFQRLGCRMADLSLSTIPVEPGTEHLVDLDQVMTKRRNDRTITMEERELYRFRLLADLARVFHERNWVMQLHLFALRNNNSRMHERLGRDSGFDSINDAPVAVPLNRFLDHLNLDGKLPRTILYTLNPAYNEVIASTIGNFQEGPVRGKMQFGSAWWFNDHIDGMRRHMEVLSSMGMISTFIGMLTDSRSFLSFVRHEYFRRVLAEIFGREIHDGLIPEDYESIGRILQDMAFHNAREYLSLPEDCISRFTDHD